MGIIRVLNEGTINQIAAGEVIENPASVVKELVENSLDAGARRIWVEIRGGGFQLIQVADDGSGMSRDDAVLCFERHATSKLKTIEDLNELYTMGFRGEALASIAAVAKVDLVTAEEGKDAVEVTVEGGAIVGVRGASRSHGTTISVRSLFYNVPARKKFQKSAAVVTGEIHRLLFALALARPDVGFELIAGEQVLLSVMPEDDALFLANIENRIEKVFNASFLQGRRPIDHSKDGYTIQGWIGSPVDDRVNRSGQYLFINERGVISPLVASAIKGGYGHRMDEKRYPIFVLHLQVPSDEIDVNVHPQKREVRFQNEEKVKQFLHEAIHSAFQEPPSTPKTFQESGAISYGETSLRFREEAATEVPTFIEHPDVIGLYEHYLLVHGGEKGIIWVDLQKAQERVLIQSLNAERLECRSQALLLPISLHLSKQDQLALKEKEKLVQNLGFLIEMSGKDQFLISAVPSYLDAADAAEGLRVVLTRDDPISTMAAFAVRGKKRFMLQEAIALWHQVKDSPDRSVIVATGPHEIKNFFR